MIELFLDCQRPVCRVGNRLVEKPRRVATSGFRHVHRGIGVLEQLRRRISVLRKQGDTDRSGDTNLATVGINGRLQRCLQGPAEGFNARTVTFGQHDHKFIATEPGKPRLPARRRGVLAEFEQPLSDPRQQHIAKAMAQRVIDPFQLIKVDEQDGEIGFVFMRSADQVIQLLVKLGTVWQAGQRIVQRQKADAFLRRTSFCQVAHDDQSLFLAFPIEVAHAVFDGQDSPILMQCVAFVRDFLAGAHDLSDLGLFRQRHKLKRGVTNHFRREISQHAQQRRVDVGNDAVDMKGDTFNTRRHELAQSLAALAVLHLGAPVLRNVRDHHESAVNFRRTPRHQADLDPAFATLRGNQ